VTRAHDGLSYSGGVGAQGTGGQSDQPKAVRERRRAARRVAMAAAAGAIALTGVTGCAKMDASLDQQWITVNFNPGTSVTTALQVRTACSHIQNTPPLALPAKHSVINIMYGVRYNTTNSSPANVAQLQTCLQKYKSVEGLDPEDAGDEGD
jgi:hypothetical protein